MKLSDKKWLWKLARLIVLCCRGGDGAMTAVFDGQENKFFPKTDEGWDIED